MNERGEATPGDLRVRLVWHQEEAAASCSVGPGCREANPEGRCCGEIAWVEFATNEQVMVLPGKRRTA